MEEKVEKVIVDNEEVEVVVDLPINELDDLLNPNLENTLDLTKELENTLVMERINNHE